VVGSGPAGSVAALTLARGGARVALVDKAAFPREKACGDLIGPRGVRLLEELAVDLPGSRVVDDMVVVGPSGRRVNLPCPPGITYPGRALALPRARFDALLHEAAVAAGAHPFTARAQDPVQGEDGRLTGFALSTGQTVTADVVIGADGATSRVAEAAGLVEGARVLWGFALRAYVPDAVSVPHILFWDEARWHGFPGYGWLFPGTDGRSNFGLGVGVLADRTAGAHASRQLAPFTEHLAHLGLLPPGAEPAGRLGGWLKMGMVGTRPAAGTVLLVGDAAGLVNPLQGEGIAPAMGSARAAAEAVLADPGHPAPRYLSFLRATYAPYQSVTAPVHGAMLRRPRIVSGLGRVLTAPGLSRVIAGGWSVFWNDLLVGASPGPARRMAAVAASTGRAVTRAGATRKWFDQALGRR
jgi:geranylgeranyl reductase family protein